LAVTCDTDRINQGDELELDLSEGIIKNKTQGTEIEMTPLPDVMIKILNDGGLAKHVEKYGDFQLV